MYAVTSYRVAMQVSSSYSSNTIPSKISESEGVILYNTIFGELTSIRFITEIKTLIRKGTDPALYYIKNQQDATLALLFISNCKITLHVSDAFCVHHQDY